MDHTSHLVMIILTNGHQLWYVIGYNSISTNTSQLHQYGIESTAILTHPLNIHKFDSVSLHTIVSKSPLLQAQLKAMEKEKGPQLPQAPVFNIILPNNAYSHFQQAPRDPFPLIP
jgi:hypothetical protein